MMVDTGNQVEESPLSEPPVKEDELEDGEVVDGADGAVVAKAAVFHSWDQFRLAAGAKLLA